MSAPTPSDRRPRVAVLFGGRSSEHAISCVTAGSVLQAIDPEKYDVVPIGIAQDGHWVLESARRRAAGDHGSRGAAVGRRVAADADAVAGGRQRVAWWCTTAATCPREFGQVDVVFPLLHGPFGEDGTRAGAARARRRALRRVRACCRRRSGMDKHYMKVVLEAAGLPILPYAVVTDRAWRTDRDQAAGRGRRPRLPRVRQAVPWRLQHRHQQGARPGRPRRRGRGGAALGPQGRRRGVRRGRRA